MKRYTVEELAQRKGITVPMAKAYGRLSRELKAPDEVACDHLEECDSIETHLINAASDRIDELESEVRDLRNAL
jgi:hypothetical protein